MGPSVICGAWPEGGGAVRCLSTRQPRGPGTGNSRPGPGAWGARLLLGAGGRRGCRGWSPCRRRSANSQRGRLGGNWATCQQGSPARTPQTAGPLVLPAAPSSSPGLSPCPRPELRGRRRWQAVACPQPLPFPGPGKGGRLCSHPPEGLGAGAGWGVGMGGGLWESESLGSDVTLAASRTR